MKQISIIVVTLLIAGAAYFIFIKDAGGSVALSAATDKDSYAAGERVELTVGLTNTGNGTTCVSKGAKGAVRILSVTRDGESVLSRSARSYYIMPLPELMKRKLVELAAGERVDVSLISEEDPGLQTTTLSTTVVNGSAGQTTFYDIGKPGAYEVSVAYQYEGAVSDTCRNVFKGATDAASVSFTVTQ